MADGTSNAGRPRKEIDIDELEKLAALQCTFDELADWFGISRRSIVRRMQEPEYREVWERGQGRGKVSLRRTQVRLAEKNAAMAIFLGKQYLGQRDVSALQVTGKEGGPIQHMDLTRLTNEQLENLERIVATASASAGPDGDTDGDSTPEA